TSCASAQTASAQSRRAVGTSRTAPRPAAAATGPSQLMAPRAPRRGALAAGCCPDAPRYGPAPPRPAPSWRRRVRQRGAGPGGGGAGPVPARPASTPRLGRGRPAGSGSGTACPTSARSAGPARTRAATPTAARTTPRALTPSEARTQDALPWGQSTYVDQ